MEEFEVATRRFVELFGDIDVNKINRTHARDFREKLRLMPKRPPNDVKQLPIVKQIEWASKNNHPVLSKDTVAKLVGGLKSVLDQVAKHNDFITNLSVWTNPFSGFTGSGQRSHKAVRMPFTESDLLKAFDPQKYDHLRPSLFWIPLILYFTGARRNEISQLHISDVFLEDPSPHFKITATVSMEDDDDDEFEENASGLAKKVKTWSSDRVAPIVPQLFQLGLKDFVDHARGLGSAHLFKDLPHEKEERRADKLSQRFSAYLRKKAGITNPLIVLHSLRHTFAMSCEGTVEPDHKKLAMGHYLENEAAVENYAIHMRHDPQLMKKLVHDKITFAPIDIVGLRKRATEILEIGEWRPYAKRKK